MNCMDEQSSNEGRVDVRTTAKNKDEMRKRLSKFATIAGVSYLADKVHKEARLYARNMCVTTPTETKWFEHNHKMTRC